MRHPESSTGWTNRSRTSQTNWFLALSNSAFVWGTALTVAFYTLIPYLPLPQDQLHRYFSSHWILYAEVWFFGIGLAILMGKAIWTPREKAAVRLVEECLPAVRRVNGWSERLASFSQGLQGVPATYGDCVATTRATDLCEYLGARNSADSVEEHLKYLHEVAGEKLHDSYALSRTIIWAIPILGFLGTVIGITMAIANITPDQLEQSMSEITSGLAVAFDTTALALSLSMILVFGAFVVERGEQRILATVESLGMRELATLFGNSGPVASPFQQAEQEAATQLLVQTEKLVNWQTDLWQQSLDGLRTRWEQIVQKQQSEFSQTLQTGMQATLAQHHSELAAARQELADTFSQLSTNLVTMVNEVQERSLQYQATTAAEISSLWENVQDELRLLREEQSHQTQELIHKLGDEVHAWQAEIKTATHTSIGQVRELQAQGETLLKIVGEEADLSRLQRTLADNLDAIRAVETFEKALHTLTAAVHMLTIKNRAA